MKNGINRIASNIKDYAVKNPVMIIAAALFVYFSIKCIATAATDSFSFDGALNAQVAENFAEHGRYATSYVTDEQDTEEFSDKVATGPLIILPVAAMFKIFGENFASGLMVNAAYMILLLAVMLYYMKECLKIKDIFLIPAILLFYGTPWIFNYGFGIFGEIPALFYFMVCVIFIHKYRTTLKRTYLFAAGLSLGAGVLTKTVIFIAVPALIFTAFMDVIVKYRSNKVEGIAIKRELSIYVIFPAGFIAPVALFELYKIFFLGWNKYTALSQDLLAKTLLQAGLRQGFDDTHGFVPKFLAHVNLLPEGTLTNKFITGFFLLSLLAVITGIVITRIIYAVNGKKPVEKDKFVFNSGFMPLGLTALSYYGWWLLITPTQKAWPRRVIDGTILLETCVVILIHMAAAYIDKKTFAFPEPAKKKYKLLTNIALCVLMAGAVFTVISQGDYGISFTDTRSKRVILETGAYIKSLPPEAEIFGYGWWQAPIASFISRKKFENLLMSREMQIPGEKAEKYLVTDFPVKVYDREELKTVLAYYDYAVVFTKLDYTVYKLFSRRQYSAFTNSEKNSVADSTLDFGKKDPRAFVRNVYLDNWAQMASGYLLKYNGQKKLKAVLFFPELKNYSNKNIQLKFYVNGTRMKIYSVKRDGINEIDIPLDKVMGSTLELSMICNAHVISDGDVRELAAIVEKIELY